MAASSAEFKMWETIQNELIYDNEVMVPMCSVPSFGSWTETIPQNNFCRGRALIPEAS